MYSKSDWNKALSKLLRLTSDSSLKWSRDASHSIDEDRTAVKSFRAVRGTMEYVASSYREKVWTDVDDYFWGSGYLLEIFSKENPFSAPQLVATSPDDIPILVDLFRMIEQKFAFDSKALDSLLTDEEDEVDDWARPK